MKRLLLGVFTAVATLAVLIGVGVLLADRQPETVSAPEEAVAATEVREETLPAETETLPLERVPEETEVFLTAENSGYAAIPRYYQTDYPYI